MPKRINVKAGDRFGRLIVVKELEKQNGRRIFLFKCDCGKNKIANLLVVKRGDIKSCGCLQLESMRMSTRTHGLSKIHLYKIWGGMKSRCLNPKTKGYKYYGDRGIIICKEWMEFMPFYYWALTNGYKKDLTIERKNNDQGYSAENCTFIPKEEQAKNRRGLHLISFNGVTKNLKEWSKVLKLNYLLLYKRIYERGWSIKKAFNTPRMINKWTFK